MTVAETRIPEGLTRRGGPFVPESDGRRRTLLTRMTDTRGHELGWIGLTVAGDAEPPAPEPIRAAILRMTRPDEEA